ncbi:MAG TPA: pyruvate kinase [Terriglobia bacterium]|nr:pyruvate kinase [Terriglobia bacterium]
MGLANHRTKIVATIGPASESREILEQMIRAGMNVARLNFSHGDFSAHQRVIQNIRWAANAARQRVAIMADLSGPKMRIGTLSSERIDLKVGDPFRLTTRDIVGDQHRVSVSFPRLPRVVKPGDALFLNDGYVQLEVTEAQGDDVVCTVKVGGELRSRKGLNLPGIDLGISAFTERDRECLKFALENGVDAVSQSFVERADDIQSVRAAAKEWGFDPFIIAKIERSRALDHIDGILDAADGIMIARGDLGVEVPIERIAVVQKDLMRRANRRARPVITATQMLESMTTQTLPTRAEATDVSNAILDGTDCVMLSGESAMGAHPVESVAMLSRIAAAVEPTRRRVAVRDMYSVDEVRNIVRPVHLVALAVEAGMDYSLPVAVFAPTLSGASARRMAALRLPVWTVAVSPHQKVCQDLLFSSGVAPVHEASDPASWKAYAGKWVQEQGLPPGLVFLIAGPSPQNPEANHRMEIIEL